MKNKIYLRLIIFTILIAWGAYVPETFAKKNLELANQKYSRAILFMDSNPTLAMKELSSAAKLSSKDPRIFAAIGKIHFRQNKYQEAIDAFNKAIKVDKAFVDAYSNLGYIYASLKDWDKAIQNFRIILKYPNFTAPHYVHNAIGWAYYGKNEFKKSIEELKKAIKLKENYAIAYYNLGLSRMAIENDNEAIKEFKMATKIQPDLFQAHYQLGLIFLKKNMEKEARAKFQMVIKLAPDSQLAKEAKNYLKIMG